MQLLSFLDTLSPFSHSSYHSQQFDWFFSHSQIFDDKQIISLTDDVIRHSHVLCSRSYKGVFNISRPIIISSLMFFHVLFFFLWIGLVHPWPDLCLGRVLRPVWRSWLLQTPQIPPGSSGSIRKKCSHWSNFDPLQLCILC